MYRFFLIAILESLFLVSASSAQSNKQISLSSAIDIAKQHSATIKELQSAYRQAILEHDIYKASHKPSLTLVLTPSRYNRNKYNAMYLIKTKMYIAHKKHYTLLADLH